MTLYKYNKRNKQKKTGKQKTVSNVKRKLHSIETKQNEMTKTKAK